MPSSRARLLDHTSLASIRSLRRRLVSWVNWFQHAPTAPHNHPKTLQTPSQPILGIMIFLHKCLFSCLIVPPCFHHLGQAQRLDCSLLVRARASVKRLMAAWLTLRMNCFSVSLN